MREEQNWIGGRLGNPSDAAFVPPPEDLVMSLLAKTELPLATIAARAGFRHPETMTVAFTRRHGDVELLVLVNVSGSESAVEIPDLEDWSRSDLLLGTIEDGAVPAWPVLLRPWEARVHRRRVAGR